MSGFFFLAIKIFWVFIGFLQLLQTFQFPYFLLRRVCKTVQKNVSTYSQSKLIVTLESVFLYSVCQAIPPSRTPRPSQPQLILTLFTLFFCSFFTSLPDSSSEVSNSSCLQNSQLASWFLNQNNDPSAWLFRSFFPGLLVKLDVQMFLVYVPTFSTSISSFKKPLKSEVPLVFFLPFCGLLKSCF